MKHLTATPILYGKDAIRFLKNAAAAEKKVLGKREKKRIQKLCRVLAKQDKQLDELAKIFLNKKRREKTAKKPYCECCTCTECKQGIHRDGHWYCPVFNCQICDVCCYYDMDGMPTTVKGCTYNDVRKYCKKSGCPVYFNEIKE